MIEYNIWLESHKFVCSEIRDSCWLAYFGLVTTLGANGEQNAASKIRDAYAFLAQNFDDGDEICLFGWVSIEWICHRMLIRFLYRFSR